MISKKEFYFVRHGQTDGNVSEVKVDHGDIPLNTTGREQARLLQPIIASLPLKTVCSSPLKRAIETKEIACSTSHFLIHKEIQDLSECNTQIWLEMTNLGKKAHASKEEPVCSFMKRALRGINQALAHEGPVLIIAHGGVHWAACCQMGIEQHHWLIDNCILTLFSIGKDGVWKAKKLN